MHGHAFSGLAKVLCSSGGEARAEFLGKNDGPKYIKALAEFGQQQSADDMEKWLCKMEASKEKDVRSAERKRFWDKFLEFAGARFDEWEKEGQATEVEALRRAQDQREREAAVSGDIDLFGNEEEDDQSELGEDGTDLADIADLPGDQGGEEDDAETGGKDEEDEDAAN